MFDHLNGKDNLIATTEEEDSPTDAARRRVLGRLGEYTSLIITPLNMRPTSATLLFEDDQRIEVRISTTSRHIILAIVPNGDMAAEVFFLRSMATKQLPAPRLIAHDLNCTVVPFTYALLGHIGGIALQQITESSLVRVAARQVGRTMRRMHQMTAPGFGRPATTGRWPKQTWLQLLDNWTAQRELGERAADILGNIQTATLVKATLEHPALRYERPCVIHGKVNPNHAIVTVGDSVQLEALIQPSNIVGGDPMFDLAYSMLPHHHSAFRHGVWEGYTATGSLAPEQEQRFQRLKLLLWVTETLWNDEEVPNQFPEAVANELNALA